MRVQYRRFIDTHRRRRRSPFGSDRLDPTSIEAIPSRDLPTDAIVDGLAAGRDLDAAWARLNQQQRALLALHAEGYDLDELSAMTGASKNALSARLHRARTRLASLLGAADLACLPAKQLES